MNACGFQILESFDGVSVVLHVVLDGEKTYAGWVSLWLFRNRSIKEIADWTSIAWNDLWTKCGKSQLAELCERARSELVARGHLE